MITACSGMRENYEKPSVLKVFLFYILPDSKLSPRNLPILAV